MFTGIVQAVGEIVRLRPFEIESAALDLADMAVGDSICVQGVCLTVTGLTGRGFTADVSRETLAVTSGLDRPGPVNLEKSLAVGTLAMAFAASALSLDKEIEKWWHSGSSRSDV